MVRVCFSILLPLMLLSGCATDQAQTNAVPPVQVASPPSKEGLLGCAYKTSVVDAWSCASENASSP